MRFIFIISFSLITTAIFANGLSISNPVYNSVTNQITFDISWSNAWKVHTTVLNFSSDGAWIFVKYAPNGGAAWQHIDILSATTSMTGFNVEIGNNGHGVMLIPDFCLGNNSCDVSNVSVSLNLAATLGVNPDFKVFGTEMVKIPDDPFYLGDGVSTWSFYTYPDTLDHYYVNSSAEITTGTSAGLLSRKNAIFNTPVPAEYPKGYREFWVMKYKISMEQYTEFLNTLDRVSQNNRTASDISSNTVSRTYVMTNSISILNRQAIRCDTNIPAGPVHFYCDLDGDGVPNEANDGQNLIANYLSVLDYHAFLDWSALRPYSRMEYEKMCRGPLNPVAGEYAWGAASYSVNGNLVNAGAPNETFDNVGTAGPIWPDFSASNFSGARCGFAANSTSTRLSAGATFYGLMDMHCGADIFVNESTLSLPNFHYFNSQGDGTLSVLGEANVAAWDTFLFNYSPAGTFIPISQALVGTVSNTSYRLSELTGRGVVSLQL